ncbi:MAG TPA: hypothetical protein VMS17_18775 [Gemmataceae bacterium]|nr:hypothetical protein [Gemmataceae bacterium]
MPEQSPPFRDFGLLPEGLQPPAEKIRAFLSPGRIAGQFIGTAIVSALGLGLTLLFALTLSMPLSLLACAAAVIAFGTFVYLATHNDYRWVELEGDVLRARRLYRGRTIERSVQEIECLGTMVYPIRTAATVVVEGLLGRVKGIEIRFRDRRTPLRIMRADPAMSNAQALIEAVLYRMKQIREIEADLVNFAGRPLVRNIHWKGEQPAVPAGRNLKVILCCLILLTLLFGTVLAFWGRQEQELQRLASEPPHEIALEALIRDGPGANRHITLTDFRPGGYVFETESNHWTEAWVALFPVKAPAAPAKAIQVVLSSKVVRDEADLQRLLQQGRVTGICSEKPSSSWGTELGPKLEKMNPGCTLTSAWSVAELRAAPSAATVTAILTGSASCFVAVLVLALILYWKAR